MVMMLMINKDGQTSQEADLQSWPLLHLRTAARTQPARTQYLHKEDDDDIYYYDIIYTIMNMPPEHNRQPAWTQYLEKRGEG